MSKGRNWKLSLESWNRNLERAPSTQLLCTWAERRQHERREKYLVRTPWPHKLESMTNLWLENSSLFHKLETLKFYTLKASGNPFMNSLTGFRTGDLPGLCSNCHNCLWRHALHILPTYLPKVSSNKAFSSAQSLTWCACWCTVWDLALWTM